MSKQAFHILISRIHKIAGVIIVIQILFWAAGGMDGKRQSLLPGAIAGLEG